MKFHFARFAMLLLILVLPTMAHAQLANPSNPNDSLVLSVSPQYPKPNDDVVVTLDGYSTNLDAATIVWSVNDIQVASGIGKKEITFNVGLIGSITRISVQVIPEKGLPVTKKLTVSASNVHILWEAKTYTPSFYPGKALFTPQSKITVVAIPEFTGQNSSTAPNALIYEWTLNDFVLNDQSGYGKQSVSFDGNYWGRDERLKVNISSKDESFSTEKTITIHPENPKVLIYENNPLLGVLTNHAITSDFTLNSKSPEVSFFAAPYFFRSNLLSNGTTGYEWTMNGAPISENNGNTVTFRNDSNLKGASIVGLDVSQNGSTYQTISANFSIIFK